MLKGCFQSLKEIRCQVLTTAKHDFIILWITCCLILHNLIIHIEEDHNTVDYFEWYEEGQEDCHGENIEDEDDVENGSDDGENGGENGEDDENGAEGNSSGRRRTNPQGLSFRLEKMDILLSSIN